MDRLMDNRWVTRIIALLLALLLFASVSFENQPTSKSPAGLPLFSNYTETLTEIPVNTYYDDQNLVVSGVPQYVNVTIEGPSGVTKREGLQKEIEVYADLTQLTVGTHKVKLQYRNISEKIKVKIDPAEITVVIQEKVTKEFPVEVDFVNRDQVAEGYTIEKPVVSPRVVKITGALEDIEKIALVKAVVDLKGVTENFTQESRVAVYDRNQNVLSVTVEPGVVEITVPIVSPNKSVSFTLKQKGKLADGLSLVNITPTPNQVTIFGPKDIIDAISSIEGEIDLDKIKEDSTIEVKVPIPKGVIQVLPDKIEVAVDVEEEISETFSDIAIRSQGLGSQYSLSFLDPEAGTINLDLQGAPSVIEGTSPTNLDVYIDVANLGIGEHDVDIKVNGPDNVTWALPQEKARIQITETEE
ncbi:YbbR-like domain-containing protein [Bacillus sinesaloumensis]|uniref:CdaR family protein n=1 Tax=Litchfieldia sinesaloumensis TaxID=1926280 RepID=UPI0009885BCE|nr:CdaR family protein [Bacillus sinesaloumensis]